MTKCVKSYPYIFYIMNKKINYLIAVLSVWAITPSFSQNYIPLLDGLTRWDIGYYSMGHICGYSDASPNRYIIGEDTVLKSKTYKTFNVFPYTSIQKGSPCPPFILKDTLCTVPDIFMREDVNSRKVYRYDENADGSELLIFDFDASVGTTTNEYIIDTIYNITTADGINRKYFSFNKHISFEEGFITGMGYLEGIGGNQGPFCFPTVPFEDHSFLMQCVTTDETIIYAQHSGDIINSTNNLIANGLCEIFPNPSDDEIHIKFNRDHGKKTIKIYSLSGSLIRTYTTQASLFSISRLGLRAGLYIVEINAFEHTHIRQKVIFQ